MSIQDESFPEDEFLDELNSFANAGIRFQFPHHHHHSRHRCCPQAEEHKPPSVITTNTSATSSSTSSSCSADQNLSNDSINGRPSSGMSSKTTESDPTGLADNASKKSDFNGEHHSNRAVSYQDIHSEYTKRRYKHVESKVGQYIANMKAEDQKRRNSTKFQRHRSMPEALSNSARNAVSAARRTSAGELHNMNESATTAASDDVEEELEEAMEPGANSSENTSGDGGTTASAASTSGGGRHESSPGKQTYAQLASEKERIQSYSDYLQTRLDEMIGENMRLKRNVDFMRIELGNAKDKLKKQSNMGGGGSRNSLHTLLYSQMKSSCATQTELLTPSPPPLQLPPLLKRNIVMHFVTPAAHDANNNSSMFEIGGGAVAVSSCKPGKSVATIQPLALNFSNIVEQDSIGANNSGNRNGGIGDGGVLRQRTNSNPNAKTPKPRAAGACSSGCPSSSGDSAIEIESAELPSPRASLRSLLVAVQREDGAAGLGSQRRREQEFLYYDKRSGRYTALETLNAADRGGGAVRCCDENDESVGAATADGVGQRKKKHHQHISLRRRWLRLFGPCTRCPDANQTLDSSALQQTYTQIPLLEKSVENYCRNLR